MSVFTFAALAVLYGGAASAVLAGAAWMVGARSVGRLLPTLFTVLVFAFLTQHPFPERGALVCPVPEASPALVPLADMGRSIVNDIHRGMSLKNILTNAGMGVTVMNLITGVAIGAALTLHRIRWRTAVLLGFILSLALETTQLTGVWGLYPCAYRKFDVDDLLTNTLGVALGYALVVRWRLATVARSGRRNGMG